MEDNQGQNRQIQGQQGYGMGDLRNMEELERQETRKRFMPERMQYPSTNEASRGDISASSRGRELTLQSTAYTWTGRKTATGPWPKDGVTIAVNPTVIPFHSKVFIEGVGWRTAEDRIPRKSIEKGASIDIYMGHREADAWKWGRRDVRVRVMPPQ